MGTNNGNVADDISNSYKYGEGETCPLPKRRSYAGFSLLYYKTYWQLQLSILKKRLWLPELLPEGISGFDLLFEP